MKPGDLIFFTGTSFFSRLIQRVTGGEQSHVAVAVTDHEVFETTRGGANFANILTYQGIKIEVMRLRLKWMGREERRKILGLCKKYEGAPYSYWDCFTNFIFRPLPAKWREKTVATLGNKHFMKCDELVQRVIFEATKYPGFKDFESLTPSDLFWKCEISGDFEEVK